MPRYGFDKPWFGFAYGQVHFVVMSTEHDFAPGTEQYYWIKHYLPQVDRSVTPWLVFTGHRYVQILGKSCLRAGDRKKTELSLNDFSLLDSRPMYIGSREDEHTEFAEEMQEHLEDLLYVNAKSLHHRMRDAIQNTLLP